MMKLDWVESGELCVSCGVCCGDVSTAPMRLDDIQRIMEGCGLTFEQVKAMCFEPPDTEGVVFDMERGCCQAMRIEPTEDGRKYWCSVYKHRPEICSKYRCAILVDLDEFAKKDGTVEQSNMFHGIAEDRLKSFALLMIRAMRSQFRWNYIRPDAPTGLPVHIVKRSTEYFNGTLVQIDPWFPPVK